MVGYSNKDVVPAVLQFGKEVGRGSSTQLVIFQIPVPSKMAPAVEVAAPKKLFSSGLSNFGTFFL
jgi:hypothetical protein